MSWKIKWRTAVQTVPSGRANQFRFCLIVCVFVMASCSTGSVSSPPEGPVVPLSFRPIQIISANGALWIAGTDESIATSQDGGATWELKHNNKGGEVLVDLGWLNAKSGYAGGTRGLFLWTADGGKTWTPRAGATGTTLQVSFGDEQHGIRRMNSTAEFTSNGGARWAKIPALKPDKPVEGDQTILDVVALDSNRMAVSLQHGDYPKHDNVLISTDDGGKRWTTVEMPLMQFTLVGKDGEYWAAGRKNVGHVVGSDGSETKLEFPLVTHSRDGEKWTNRSIPAVDLGPCNSQGCLLWDGVWSDPTSGMPPYWIFPPRSSWGSMTYKWAAAAGRICTLDSDLVCTDSTSSTAIPSKSKSGSGVTINIVGNGLDQHALGDRCLSCPIPILVDPDQPGLWGGNGALVKFVIRKNGTVDQVRMTNWFGSKFKAPLTNAMQKWVLQPVLDKDGVRVDQEEDARVDFILVHPPEQQ
jgi:photosystem II stability/assembly factor-like uncharacterized protein